MHFDPENYRLETSVGFQIHRVKSILTRRSDERLLPHGITSTQASVLLACQKYQTAAEISRFICNDAAALKRTLDKLAARGLIERAISPADKRQHRLSLTIAGMEMAERIPAAYCATLNETFACLSNEEVGFLKSLLQRVIEQENTGIRTVF